MATSRAVLADVTGRALRPLTDVEQAWCVVRLDDAFQQLTATIPGLATLLDGSGPDDSVQLLVVQVQCQMVLRVLSNPDGVLEETVDDYTRRLDAAVSSGALYVTAAEQALVVSAVAAATVSGGTGGAFSVRPIPQPVVYPW